jgi:hypothetical protein
MDGFSSDVCRMTTAVSARGQERFPEGPPPTPEGSPRSPERSPRSPESSPACREGDSRSPVDPPRSGLRSGFEACQGSVRLFVYLAGSGWGGQTVGFLSLYLPFTGGHCERLGAKRPREQSGGCGSGSGCRRPSLQSVRRHSEPPPHPLPPACRRRLSPLKGRHLFRRRQPHWRLGEAAHPTKASSASELFHDGRT